MPSSRVLNRIVSGGQAGVDRAALDAALDAGLPCGGWCPKGRLAEDGKIPRRYPLREMPSTGYADRTRRNVDDADATLIIAFGQPEGGTLLTIEHAQSIGRPCLLIDAYRQTPKEAAAQVRDWLTAHKISTLNVAGPRASKQPQASIYTYDLITAVVRRPPKGA